MSLCRNIANVLVVCGLLVLFGCGNGLTSAEKARVDLNRQQLYEQDGITLQLPEGWAVVEDFYPVEDRRRINVITVVGSSVTIDIFNKVLAPTIAEHFANYIAAVLPPEMEESSSIDSGEVVYGNVLGLFAAVTLSAPFNVGMHIEALPVTQGKKQAYFIFNTQPELKGEVSRHVENILSSVLLN